LKLGGAVSSNQERVSSFMLARKAKAVVFGALAIASAIGGTLALEAGCTVLTNDALPDDAGIFEGGDGKAPSCALCLSTNCAAPQALCLTNASCAAILTCAAGASDAIDAGDAGDNAGDAGDAGDASACACGATAATGASPDRLYHAYTSCNDAKIATCANDCAAENRAPSTLPACAAAEDGGTSDDAGDAGTADDAGPTDAGADADATVPGTDACLACAASNCAANVAACGSATECGDFLACSSACTGTSCLDDCAAQHATGKVAATELATCTARNCPFACEL
jgi:hypothetical protein